jgi:4-hydroxy-2-oxoheptanedioate aldolase
VADIPRLNGVIRALESGKPAITTFSPPEIGMAQAINAQPYDAVIFEMEHNPFDVQLLRNCMQYMLDRKQILKSGSIAPAVTPMVRIPVNGAEMNQFIAKQVLDIGVYGIVFPHITTVEQARNAVAACRYARPPTAKYYEPHGQRGDAPKNCAPYWGLTQQEYYTVADVWPLNPKGEIFVILQCESVKGLKNLPQILKEVPGIGCVLIGEGDLSQDLGFPRQYEHPTVAGAIDEILAICKEHKVVCGHPHANAKNIEGLIAKGFQFLMTLPTYSFAGLEVGRKASGRA